MTAPNYAELVERLRKFGEPVCRFKGDDPVEYACEGGTCKCYELTVQEVYSAADLIEQQAREIEGLKQYVRHNNGCNIHSLYGTGGFCDCGLDAAMREEGK